ncbi:MAG: polysaccharide deacetylase family protein [Chitinophagaceae bacterium]|nr:polysaccharide deacetylase family protein [Chitinophagaceae bacterium]
MDRAITNELLIYTPEVSPRLGYIANTLSGGKVRISSDKAEIEAHAGPVINYSPDPITGALHIQPHGLLTENAIKPQSPDCFEWNGLKVFFRTAGDIPFDLFAAAFYLISRYEEYLPHSVDAYGRYAHENSLAYRNEFLNQPLVNLWMQRLDVELSAKFPQPTFKMQHSKFRFLPTYDIDIAYAYAAQPVWKNVAGFFRDLLQGKIDKVIERGNSYTGRHADPFDTFGWLDELHARYRLKPAYFFLTLIKRGLYDKNLPAASAALQRLYKKLAAVYVTGLHPSWRSGDEEGLLLQEKEKLEAIVGHRIFVSRNHYLRFTLPHSYRRLSAAGITDDHSMAYGTVNGFRASYALPFRWYDLEKEQVTQLVVHPFCFMEANSFFQQHYSAEQAGAEIQYYYDTVKNVEGELITLFHNHFLTLQPEWVEWRRMYEQFLQSNFG